MSTSTFEPGPEPDDREDLARLRAQLQAEYDFDVRMMTNRSVILGAGDPGMIGARLLENGIRYGAVLGASASQPLFSSAVLALERAAKIPSKTTKPTTVYDALYGRFLVQFGLCVAEPLQHESERPPMTAHLEMALAALTMAFTDRIGSEARRNPAAFRTPEFSSYALATLSLARVAQLWDVAISGGVVEEIAGIPLHRQHDRLRRALKSVLQDPNATTEKELQDAFRATFNVRAYRGVFIANLQFTHAYACSLARYGGRMLTALTHLLSAE